MAQKRKGQLVITPAWAKHLRKLLKRQFWKAERKAGNMYINKRVK